MQPTDSTTHPDLAGLVTPGIILDLTAEHLTALAAGGVDPIPEDPTTMTDAVRAVLDALIEHAFGYGGRVAFETPVISITCPWSSDASRTGWFRRLRQRLLVATGLDVASGTATMDGWTVTVRGEQS